MPPHGDQLHRRAPSAQNERMPPRVPHRAVSMTAHWARCLAHGRYTCLAPVASGIHCVRAKKRHPRRHPSRAVQRRSRGQQRCRHPSGLRLRNGRGGWRPAQAASRRPERRGSYCWLRRLSKPGAMHCPGRRWAVVASVVHQGRSQRYTEALHTVRRTAMQGSQNVGHVWLSAQSWPGPRPGLGHHHGNGHVCARARTEAHAHTWR